MERSADDSPPPYFGDYPHGAYWSAFRQDSSVDDDGEAEDFTVEGTNSGSCGMKAPDPCGAMRA